MSTPTTEKYGIKSNCEEEECDILKTHLELYYPDDELTNADSTFLLKSTP